MVAIHIPRPADDWADDWGADDVPVGRPADDRRSAGPLRRRLPDRATRVRRRRLALLLAVVAVGLASMVAVQSIAGLARVGGTTSPRAVDVGPQPIAGQTYVVQPGDTLWSIAVEIAPDRDPRAVVAELRSANGGPALEVGDELTLGSG